MSETAGGDPGTTLPAVDERGYPTGTSWLSVLQFFVKETEQAAFEADMEEMYELAAKQPGYLWAHFGRSVVDGRWFVISEWASYDEMKAWEHEARHEEVGQLNEARYEPGRGLENRKFIPWYRPDKPRKQWTP